LLIRPPVGVFQPDRVVRFYFGSPAGAYAAITNYQTFEGLSLALSPDVMDLAFYVTETVDVGRGEDARRIEIVGHSRDYFQVLGLKSASGVLPSAVAAPADQAVISYAFWQEAFGGTDVLGRPLRIGPRTYTIVGVMARDFVGIDSKAVDVWVPVESRVGIAFGLNSNWRSAAGSYVLHTIGRLHAGIGATDAQARASAVYASMQTEVAMRGARVALTGLPPGRTPEATRGTLIPLLTAGMSALMLIIACGNVGSLLFVRGLRRGHEMAIKTALGATKVRLLREIIMDAALLATIAGVATLSFIGILGRTLREWFLSSVSGLVAPIDARVTLVTIAVCTVTTLLLAMAPAWRLTSRRSLVPRHSESTRSSRLLEVFVGMQVALSLPLVIGAGLFALSLWVARHQNFGFDGERVVVLTVNLANTAETAESRSVHRRIQQQLAGLPWIESIALVDQIPMRSALALPIIVPGVDQPSNVDGPYVNFVDPAIFDVLHLHVAAGRRLMDTDNRVTAQPVVVVTQTLAHAYWPHGDAVGQCIQIGDDKAACAQIVGVISDLRLWPVVDPPRRGAATIFAPIEQRGDYGRALLVRASGSSDDVLPQIRRAALAATGNLPYVDIWRFEDVFQAMVRPWRIGATIFLLFGGLSLLIAAVGVMVATGYAVTQRTREMTIRAVLGAEPASLVGQVVRRYLIAAVSGLTLGGILAGLEGPWLGAFLFGVSAHDPGIFIFSITLLLTVCVLAAWVPARRVTKLNAADALRTE
jgi:macrolide transport system ATP-binding/permease protein